MKITETAREIWFESSWVIRAAVILIALGAVYSFGAWVLS